MKTSKTCPKCASTEIILVPGHVGPYGMGNNIPTGWTNLSSVKVDRYVCAACGFSEEWIDNADDIEKLRNKFG